jgi:hypothetical protein
MIEKVSQWIELEGDHLYSKAAENGTWRWRKTVMDIRLERDEDGGKTIICRSSC